MPVYKAYSFWVFSLSISFDIGTWFLFSSKTKDYIVYNIQDALLCDLYKHCKQTKLFKGYRLIVNPKVYRQSYREW